MYSDCEFYIFLSFILFNILLLFTSLMSSTNISNSLVLHICDLDMREKIRKNLRTLILIENKNKYK